MTIIARGQVTISTVEDGANAVSIYTRSHFSPSTPLGVSPSGWSSNPDAFVNSYGVLWVSAGLKNSDGSLKGIWSKPAMYEQYNSNLLWNFPWTIGSGTTSIYHQNGSPNYREMYETPFGYDDIVWRGVSEGNNDSDGGFIAINCKIDHTKAYRMSCWFKRTSMNGSSYLGANGASKAVQVYSGGTWIERTNFYFWSGDLPEINKWYLLVGYMYGSGETNTTADSRAGIYDPVTGKKVVSFSAVSRNYPSVTANGIRVYQYYCSEANISAYFWNPRVDMLDGREPSVEELLKKSKDGETGEDGRGVLDISEQFYLSTSKLSPQGGSWSDTKPTWISSRYMWMRTKVTYTSGTPNLTYTDPYLDSSWEAIDELYDDIEEAKQAGVDAQKVADAITKKANDEGWATKLTHIDESGIFTGQLSANTVTAIKVNASQITAGVIDAARINTSALKSALITAGNINALTLDVGKGKIGGWVINSTSITSSNITLSSASKRIAVYSSKSSITSGQRTQLYYNSDTDFGMYSTDVSGNCVFRLGSSNSIAGWNLTTSTISKGSVVLGSDGSIYNTANRWKLANDGSGRIASGNISWDSSGNVTFGASVILKWSAPISDIQDNIDDNVAPKITKLTSTGIYTGTLTATQINAVAISASSIKTGTLSADRIATGSITSTKLDATSIKANIINTSYINGLSCTFTKGTIGGWTINSGSISGNNIILNDTNNRIAVFATGSSSTSGHRVQLYYSNNSSFGFYATNSAGSCIAQLGSANQISGWQITPSYIYKNSVYLGSDGSIYNGSKWRLSNDGSGSLASGNISWNTAGVVSFSSAVSLQWKGDIEAAKSENYGYRYYHSIVINGEDDKYYPVVIKGGDQTAKRDILIRRSYNEQAPPTWHNSTHKGGLTMLMKTNFGGWGGSTYSWEIYELSETYSRMFAGAQICGNCVMFAIFLRGGGTTGAKYHIYSDQPLDSDIYSPSPIPHSPQIAYNSDKIFSSGSYQAYAPAPRTLTTTVEDEIRRRKFISLAQGSDTTLKEHPLTYIGSTGIYTGTLTANQVNAVGISASSITTGTLSADRIASGSITSTKLDANSIKANIINTTYINGLTCSFTKGTIGGWSMGSDNITTGSIGGDGQRPIQLRTRSTGSGYWYSGAYKPYGISMTWHKSGNAGHIVFGEIAASGSSTKSGFMGIQMMSWDHNEYFCLSANYTKVGSKEVYNRIAGWGFDSQNIWKNSVYLGSDGSIYNGTKWKLANDGSGRLANGNITWDVSGNVSFGSAVSLNWTNAANLALSQARSYADTKKNEAISAASTDATNKANAAKELASAMAYGKMLYRDPTFYNGSNSTNVYNNLGNGAVTVTRTQNSLAPNDSKYVLRIVKNSSSASPECGGFSFQTTTGYRKILITRIIAKIPTGRDIKFASNSVGIGGSYKWLSDTAGTGDWREYIAKVSCGTSSFSSTNFYYLSGSGSVTWDVAYATVFDVTSVEKSTTTIDINGIYTGTITANQITAGTISASRIDVNSIKASILTATNINALTLTTSKGSIGGWSITSSYIKKNSVYLGSDGSIYNGTKWKLNNNGSGQLANGNISWDTVGNITAKNAVFTNVRIQGSVRNKFVLNDSAIWIGGDSSNQENFNNFDNIVAIRGSWNEDIPLPWGLENSGRRVTLVNYKWGSTISTGYMDIYAASGKYFYEDGIAKTKISFSREFIELLGYGDSSTFFGWIVVNRINLMTDSRYGKPIRMLAQGRVTGTTSGASITYKTFDNTTMSVTRVGTGKYRVYYSSLWKLTSANAVFNLTGYGYSSGYSTAPVKASVYGVYSTYFYVNVSDDASNNDGSFYFQITNMNDWTY